MSARLKSYATPIQQHMTTIICEVGILSKMEIDEVSKGHPGRTRRALNNFFTAHNSGQCYHGCRIPETVIVRQEGGSFYLSMRGTNEISESNSKGVNQECV